MAFVAAAVGGGAALGALGGLLSGGPKLSAYGQQASGYSQDALNAYRNLVSAGPGASDVTAATDATRKYAGTLQNAATTGLYNSTMGANLAQQQFAPQRQALAQSMQDQIASANRAASASGRSSNDPILRARLGAEQMRQSAALNAEQSAAAVSLGRQYTQDNLSLQGQGVNALQGLSNQAYSNQSTLFGMANEAFQGQLALRDSDKKNGGGGFLGALTGAIGGAGAGMQLAQGLSKIGKKTADVVKDVAAPSLASVAQSYAPAINAAASAAFSQPAPQANPAYFTQSNFANNAPATSAYFNAANFAQTPQRAGVSQLGPNSFSYK